MSEPHIRTWLDQEWQQALSDPGQPVEAVDYFVNSEILSMRYAVVTQLLGKVEDHQRSLLLLRPIANNDRSWPARAFAKDVVVPWVSKNNLHVIGRSGDPYVSNPLRRASITSNLEQVKHPDGWRNLGNFFKSIDNIDPGTIKTVCRKCLKSVARRHILVEEDR